jgi:L-ascorbate metabolism protein UlaG (beta-lactamase superfamily)
VGREVDIHYVGHATVRLDLPGLRILTDPFLRDRLGPLRRHGPVPVLAEVGTIDVVAISHGHPDHLDARSLRALEGVGLFVVPRRLGPAVRRLRLPGAVVEVAAGDRLELAGGWTLTAVPARHWRWPGAPRAAALGFLIEGLARPGIYFAGDTAPFRAMAAFAHRVDIALLPVGSWGPHLGPGHLSPQSAAEVARDLGARVAVPIHWGTLYPMHLDRVLGDRLTRPAERFAAWAARLAPGLDVRVLQPGEMTKIGDIDGTHPSGGVPTPARSAADQPTDVAEPGLRPIAGHDRTAPTG